MPLPIGNGPGQGFTAVGLDNSSSTGDGAEFVLETPLSNWTVTTLLTSQAASGPSTAATVILKGSATTSSGSIYSNIKSITASTGGETTWSTEQFAVRQLKLTLDSQSSSGRVRAWVTGAP
mgnify:CR=1 FL=1